MNTIRQILANRIFQIISFIGTAGAIYYSYYERKLMHCDFNKVYNISIVLLLLSIAVIAISYFDKEADNKKLINETISGYIFFIGFIVLTVLLRG